MSHQANDFQVTGAFWRKINEITERLNRDGSFVAFPGYEWSGNTPVGGDHNVFFRTSGGPIRQSSHALLEDRSDLDADANTTAELFTTSRRPRTNVSGCALRLPLMPRSCRSMC